MSDPCKSLILSDFKQKIDSHTGKNALKLLKKI